jgi:hypothetical protein
MGTCEVAHTTQPIGTSWLLGIGYWQYLTISPYPSTFICYEVSKQTSLHLCQEVLVRTSLFALHFAGVRLGSYNPFPDPTLCGSFYALGLSFLSIQANKQF